MGEAAATGPGPGLQQAIRSTHPGFRAAVLADARATSANRGRPLADTSDGRVALEALRLAWESDSFGAQILYRAKAALQRRGVPVLPRICGRLAIVLAGLRIGDHVRLAPGAHLAHGPLVIDGIVEIGPRAKIFPFVTIGLRAGNVQGPRLGAGVTVGTGAKLIGPVRVGDGARIGANAVVLDDVPAGATAVGIPARVVRDGEPPS
jgi:serine O-acetyltransferase